MAEYTEIYADFIKETRYETLSPATIAMAKKSLLDLIGVSIAGYRLMEFPRWVVELVAGMGETPEATIIGQKGHKFPALNSALANGACAHALDILPIRNRLTLQICGRKMGVARLVGAIDMFKTYRLHRKIPL